MQTFAETLIGLMDQKGIKQDELAKRSGVSQNTISNIELGRLKVPGLHM